jgi:D-cysteine desulfhydrase
MDFEFPEKLNLANLPTPIEPLCGLSAALGKEVYVKRDDLTGCATSGNKIRKLEFALAEAKAQGAQVVITAGGTQSNHCRATAVACRQVGLEPFLILRGTGDEAPDGNLLLDMLCGARIRFISPAQYSENLDSIVEEVERQERAAGRKCYFIPVGASNEVGAMGYLGCAREIARWQEEHAISFDRIYYAAGSGGTSAGLIIGQKVYELDARVRGINVGEPRDQFLEDIERIAHRALQRYEISADFDRVDIEIVDGYYGTGYGDMPEPVVNCIRRLALSDGLILDPVYTAKAMLGLIGEEEKMKGGRVLFIHTGGIFSLFAFKDKLGAAATS